MSARYHRVLMAFRSEPVLEDVPACDMCGSDRAQGMFRTRDRQHGLPGVFGLLRCSGCGLVRLSPRPTAESLAMYYPVGDYRPHQSKGIGDEGGRRLMGGIRDGLRDEALRALGYSRTAHPLLRLPARVLRRWLIRRHAFGWGGFPPFHGSGRALDIGAGSGFFLALLQRNGWSVEGVDLSPEAAETARRSFGLHVHVGEITDLDFEPGSFDFVHMSHVIEHVRSPRLTMAKVYELLRPGGLLYVETPNVASMGARMWGPLWFPLETPRHLWLFAPNTLARLTRQAGLDVDEIRSWLWDQPEWEATYLFEDRTGRSREQRPAIAWRDRPRLAASRLVAGATLAVAPRSGDVMSCWAHRPS